jgi:hypothetical protein
MFSDLFPRVYAMPESFQSDLQLYTITIVEEAGCHSVCAAGERLGVGRSGLGGGLACPG